MTKEDALFFLMRFRRNGINEQLYDALGVAIEALKAQEPKPDEKDHQEHGDSAELGSKTGETCADAISRRDAIDALNEYFARIGKLKRRGLTKGEKAISLDTVGIIKTLPSAQPIVQCKDCEYGEQDEVGRWFCRGLGCQIGNEDGSGYCADAERRTNG